MFDKSKRYESEARPSPILLKYTKIVKHLRKRGCKHNEKTTDFF